MNTLRILLDGILDYAGLFPPASLSMSDAVKNFAHYRSNPHQWILSRFVLPLARLEEFESELSHQILLNQKQNWKLSVLITPESNLEGIDLFNQKYGSKSIQTNLTIGQPLGITIDCVEAKFDLIDQLDAWIKPNEVTVYVEIPLSSSLSLQDFGETLENQIALLSKRGYRAKVRTGGITTEAFPSVQLLTLFMSICAKHKVAFKATAGLHHPTRGKYALTYEKNSEFAVMNGFLNVFLASAFLYFGMSESEVMKLLCEEDSNTFQFKAEYVQWRNHRLMLSELSQARASFGISFGSCSFQDPVDDLKNLHLLENEIK